jgi:hypothetical protein
MGGSTSEERTCSFCGRIRDRVMAGPKAYICRDCILTLDASQALPGVMATSDSVSCGFCHRAFGDATILMKSNLGGVICNTCISLGADALRPQG